MTPAAPFGADIVGAGKSKGVDGAARTSKRACARSKSCTKDDDDEEEEEKEENDEEEDTNEIDIATVMEVADDDDDDNDDNNRVESSFDSSAPRTAYGGIRYGCWPPSRRPCRGWVKQMEINGMHA